MLYCYLDDFLLHEMACNGSRRNVCGFCYLDSYGDGAFLATYLIGRILLGRILTDESTVISYHEFTRVCCLACNICVKMLLFFSVAPTSMVGEA